MSAPKRLVTEVARPAPSRSRPVADASPATAGLRALDRAVTAYGPVWLSARPPTAAAAEALAAAIRLLCAEARRSHPGRGEHLVIALRAAWPTLPAVQHLSPRHSHDRLLARVVTLAIAEFYRPTHGTGESADHVDGTVGGAVSAVGRGALTRDRRCRRVRWAWFWRTWR